MRERRIVYTRPDGGVSICAPSLTALRFMTAGGGRWDGFPPGFLDRQIEVQARHGVGEWAASRFVRAMQFGGLTTAEAYGVMRDRFCAHLGTGCELWDVEDVPTDRTYRNAWRRSHNGGPIHLDPRKVAEIQEARMWAAYEADGLMSSASRAGQLDQASRSIASRKSDRDMRPSATLESVLTRTTRQPSETFNSTFICRHSEPHGNRT